MIEINISKKIATIEGSPVIVCGNSDYVIHFTFDAEWMDKTYKTARFVYLVNGLTRYQDVIFTGNTVKMPVLANIDEVAVGVFAGELTTTTPAYIPCKRSIRCGIGAPTIPTPDQYDQIMDILDGLAPRKEWITVADTVLTEDVLTVSFDCPAKCKKLVASFVFNGYSTGEHTYYVGFPNWDYGVKLAIPRNSFGFTMSCEVLANGLIQYEGQAHTVTTLSVGNVGKIIKYIGDDTFDGFGSMFVYSWNGDWNIPSGTQVKIWGLES